MLKNAVFLLIGGGLGAVGREALMLLVTGPFSGDGSNLLPIFIANMIAALLIGLVAGLISSSRIVSAESKLFLSTGIMGGLSTYSSFIWGADNTLADPATRLLSLVYLASSMIFGFLLVQAGIWLGQRPAS